MLSRSLSDTTAVRGRKGEPSPQRGFAVNAESIVGVRQSPAVRFSGRENVPLTLNTGELKDTELPVQSQESHRSVRRWPLARSADLGGVASCVLSLSQVVPQNRRELRARPCLDSRTAQSLFPDVTQPSRVAWPDDDTGQANVSCA